MLTRSLLVSLTTYHQATPLCHRLGLCHRLHSLGHSPALEANIKNQSDCHPDVTDMCDRWTGCHLSSSITNCDKYKFDNNANIPITGQKLIVQNYNDLQN